MQYIKTIHRRNNCDIGYTNNNLEPLNNIGRVGKSGIDKNLSFEKIIEFAYEINANIIGNVRYRLPQGGSPPGANNMGPISYYICIYFIINHQSSLITHQSSVINHQSSIISYQSSIIHDQ